MCTKFEINIHTYNFMLGMQSLNLELVGRDPCVLEPDAGSLGSLTEAGQVEDGGVGAALDLQEDVVVTNCNRY